MPFLIRLVSYDNLLYLPFCISSNPMDDLRIGSSRKCYVNLQVLSSNDTKFDSSNFPGNISNDIHSFPDIPKPSWNLLNQIHFRSKHLLLSGKIFGSLVTLCRQNIPRSYCMLELEKWGLPQRVCHQFYQAQLQQQSNRSLCLTKRRMLIILSRSGWFLCKVLGSKLNVEAQLILTFTLVVVCQH